MRLAAFATDLVTGFGDRRLLSAFRTDRTPTASHALLRTGDR